MNELPDHYLCEGSPDKMMMDALKEINIDDICDFLQAEFLTSKPFKKEQHAPPPRYHLESSRGDVNDCLTSYQLQSYFGGHHLPDYSLLSRLGTGITVVDDDHDIPTIGELVNRKRGKRRRKGSKATVPLEVVGMDIGYGERTAYSGSKYVLLLVDQCTSNFLFVGCKVLPVLMCVKPYGSFLLTLADFRRQFNVILILVLSVEKQSRFFDHMVPE